MKSLLMLLLAMLGFAGSDARSQSFSRTSITAPSAFIGNHDEIFQLADGSIWKVQYEYSYLYEYYPSVSICPSAGKLLIRDKALNVVLLSAGARPPQGHAKPSPGAGDIVVVARQSGCRDYFVADGLGDYSLLQWYGGYDPDIGGIIVGQITSLGFKDVFYPKQGRTGRVYVDDYMLSRAAVIEKYREKYR
ncbi:MAG: hypothetical protein FJ248_08680 [Nitrospira sp.]|nr:hypothetical protein [Nitrospira sp.]